MADFTIKIIGEDGGQRRPPQGGGTPQQGGSNQQRTPQQGPQPTPESSSRKKVPTPEEQIAERRRKLIDIAMSQGSQALSALGLGGITSKLLGTVNVLKQIRDLVLAPLEEAKPAKKAGGAGAGVPAASSAAFAYQTLQASGQQAASQSISAAALTTVNRAARRLTRAFRSLRREILALISIIQRARGGQPIRGQVIDVSPSLPSPSSRLLLPQSRGGGLVPRGGASTFLPAPRVSPAFAVARQAAGVGGGAGGGGAVPAVAAVAAASGVGGLLVGLGALAAVVVIAAGAFLIARAAVNKFTEEINQLSRRATPYSPELSMAQSDRERRQRERDRMIAAMAGENLANFQRVQTNLEDSIDKIQIAIYSGLLEVFGPALRWAADPDNFREFIRALLTGLGWGGVATLIDELLRNMSQYSGTEMEGLFRFDAGIDSGRKPFWNIPPRPAPGFDPFD